MFCKFFFVKQKDIALYPHHPIQTSASPCKILKMNDSVQMIIMTREEIKITSTKHPSFFQFYILPDLVPESTFSHLSRNLSYNI